MIFRSIQLFGLLIVVSSASACEPTRPIRAADPSPEVSCDMADLEMFESLSSMHPQVVSDLLKSLKPDHWGTPTLMAERDTSWNGDDAIDTRLSSRRFVSGMRHENRWIVWYEQGGYFAGPRIVFVAYEVSASSNQTARLESGDYVHSVGFAALCQTTARLLRSALKPDGEANPTAR